MRVPAAKSFSRLPESVRVNQIEQLREYLARPALLFETQQDKEVSPLGSYFGAVRVAKPEEGWPNYQGSALIPMLQLDLRDLPFKPEALSSVNLLTLFVHYEPETNWCLRTYTNTDALVELKGPSIAWPIDSMTLSAAELIEDYPSQIPVNEDIEQDLWQEFTRLYPSRNGIKLGGWPLHSSLSIDSIRGANWLMPLSLSRGAGPGGAKAWHLEGA